MWLICSNDDVSADATRGHGAGSVSAVRVRVATPCLGRPRRGHAPQMAKPNGIDLVGVGQQHRLEDGQVEHLKASGTVGSDESAAAARSATDKVQVLPQWVRGQG